MRCTKRLTLETTLFAITLDGNSWSQVETLPQIKKNLPDEKIRRRNLFVREIINAHQFKCPDHTILLVETFC